jgi:hypothetical protein
MARKGTCEPLSLAAWGQGATAIASKHTRRTHQTADGHPTRHMWGVCCAPVLRVVRCVLCPDPTCRLVTNVLSHSSTAALSATWPAHHLSPASSLSSLDSQGPSSWPLATFNTVKGRQVAPRSAAQHRPDICAVGCVVGGNGVDKRRRSNHMMRHMVFQVVSRAQCMTLY